MQTTAIGEGRGVEGYPPRTSEVLMASGVGWAIVTAFLRLPVFVCLERTPGGVEWSGT